MKKNNNETEIINYFGFWKTYYNNAREIRTKCLFF